MKKLIFTVLLSAIVALSMAQTDKTPIDVNDQFSLKSQYLFNTFVDGKIFFTDGTVGSMGLNYNVIVSELHYLKDEKLMTFDEGAYLQIKKFEVGNHQFLVHDGSVFEILYSSEVALLLKREADEKDLNEVEGAYGIKSSTSSATMVNQLYTNAPGESIIAGSTVVNLKDNKEDDLITVNNSYKIKYGKTVYPSVKSTFFKIYKENKNEIKTYLAENNLNLDKEEDLLALIRYCKNL